MANHEKSRKENTIAPTIVNFDFVDDISLFSLVTGSRCLIPNDESLTFSGNDL